MSYVRLDKRIRLVNGRFFLLCHVINIYIFIHIDVLRSWLGRPPSSLTSVDSCGYLRPGPRFEPEIDDVKGPISDGEKKLKSTLGQKKVCG